MNTVFGKSSFAWIFSFPAMAAIAFIPNKSLAQTGNTATGIGSLDSNTTGSYDTANGFFALNRNTTGSYNTANGYLTLVANTLGSYDTANGVWALYNNTTGSYNTANGFDALASNTTGTHNTANGYQALCLNVLGSANTANGNGALFTNTGSYNTANGWQALYLNTTANYNTANGGHALYSNTTGFSNAANGYAALAANITGSGNVADGVNSLLANTAGSNNVAVGVSAGLSLTGSNNIAIGPAAGDQITTGSNNISIGNTGTSADTGIIRIGTAGTHKVAYIAGITGVGVRGAVPVYVNSSGQLGTVLSSARFKYDIHDLGARSDKLMELRPVTFRYKEADADGTHSLQYGLIAEEVAKVYPDLVQYDKQGKPFTVYYHLLTPMLLDQLQRAHHQLEAQSTRINSLESTVQTQSAGMSSLQHTVQLLIASGGTLALVGVAGAAMFMAGRARQLPSWRARPIENSASNPL